MYTKAQNCWLYEYLQCDESMDAALRRFVCWELHAEVGADFSALTQLLCVFEQR